MDISFFRSRVQGPEAVLEDTITSGINKIIPNDYYPSWIACSPRIGAGMPDILFVYYKPEAFALAKEEITQTQILAYLRVVNNATLEKMVSYFRYPEKKLRLRLDQLVERNIVLWVNDEYWLKPSWKNVLPKIISIEVKVENWNKALSQACRNRLFTHQSYVAMPEKIIKRIKNKRIFKDSGIGLLSVDDSGISVEISASTFTPQIWEYYYKVASLLANSRQDSQTCHSSYQLTKPKNCIPSISLYQH